MTPTDKARRSDSLHYDHIGRRTLCDMIANLESDLEESKAENDRLRERMRDMFYAVHPADREKFLTNMVELGIEVD